MHFCGFWNSSKVSETNTGTLANVSIYNLTVWKFINYILVPIKLEIYFYNNLLLYFNQKIFLAFLVFTIEMSISTLFNLYESQ